GFTGFANLVGSASGDDLFIFRTGGSLSGTLDGGAGGNDDLQLYPAGGEVTSVPSGPQSGTITFEATTVTYAGLEPILVDGAEDVTVTTTTADDVIHVAQSPNTNVTVQSTLGSMESVELTVAALSNLTVLADAPGVSVYVTSDLLLPGVNLRIVA